MDKLQQVIQEELANRFKNRKIKSRKISPICSMKCTA